MAEPNDTDAAFVAEAEVDQLAMSAAKRRAHRGHAGEELAVAPRGGIDSRFTEETSEEEPLLGNNKQAGGGDGSGAAWTGATDFEGVPWYKKPSVGSRLGGYRDDY